ncbi:MAG TPA: pirin family protein [Byssovorax sp.]|jgi:hypothetical protein
MSAANTSAVELVVTAHAKDLGGFTVRRAIPQMQRRSVGPFVFFDHMGPVTFAPGHGIDVRPHPHIGLATVTYLFDGEIVHKDSLGNDTAIRPGDVNWMIAGRGIVHSERTGPEARARGISMHGIQSWVALPVAHEEDAPSFEHVPSASLPKIDRAGVKLDVIAGAAYGARSPAPVLSPTLYVHARLDAGAQLEIDGDHEERAIYVVEGAARVGDLALAPGSLAFLTPGAEAVVTATETARVMLVGGARLDGERHLEWNFVSSSKERLERAKQAWQRGEFPKVPGDDVEFIPLPGS